MSTLKVNHATPALYNKVISSRVRRGAVSSSEKILLVPDNLKIYLTSKAVIFLDKFVRGPIPMPGLYALSKLNIDKILFTVILIFYQVSFNKDEEFKFPYLYSDLFGLARTTVKRHLKKLAELELIELKIQQSKSPLIKVDLKKWGYTHVSKQ